MPRPRRSGNPHGVGHLIRDLGRERQHHVPIERSRNASERVDPILRAAALLKPGDHRLGRAHPNSQLTLAQPSLGAQFIYELAKVKVLLDPRTHLS